LLGIPLSLSAVKAQERVVTAGEISKLGLTFVIPPEREESLTIAQTAGIERSNDNVLVGLTLFHRAGNQEIGVMNPEPEQAVFTTTVDWYTPLPKRLHPEQRVEIPYQLLSLIPGPLQAEAMNLLTEINDVNIAPLTKEQATGFSSITDPKVIVQSNIDQELEELRSFQRYPLDEADILQRNGKEALKVQKKQRQDLVNRLSSEIEQVSQWTLPPGAHLSRADAIRIAQAKISHDLASSPWNYHRTGVSYLPEDRMWAVSYQQETTGSRCVVEVEDRTGQSRILMP